VKKVRRLGRIVFLSLCGLIAVIIAAINPSIMLLAAISIASIVFVLRQLNTYKIAMQIKRFIQTANKLRAKFRASMRMGLCDYSDVAVENEEGTFGNSHCGYVR
jgi:replication-associated recombination protein RarA